MPITQNRMLTLIAATDAYNSTLRALSTFISDTASAITPDCPREKLILALQNIQEFANRSAIPNHLTQAIAEEKAHFKLNAARNERHARRAKLKRKPDAFAPKPLPPLPATTQQQTSSLSDLDLARLGVNLPLVEQKLEINKLCEQMKMPAPYPDIYDPAPLTDEHKRHFGLPVDSAAALF